VSESSESKTYKRGQIRLDNEAKILASAEQEFADRGYGGASMDRIAKRAGIARTNVHYYFNNKLDLYVAVLTGIVDLWNSAFSQIGPDDDPADALSAYIRAKVLYSKTHPLASRVFASEIIHGAPNLTAYLKKDFRQWMREKAKVIQYWVDNGKMDPVDPIYLIFMIWSSTQHYADFEVQVNAVLNKRKLAKQDYEEVIDNLTHIILKGCGVIPKGDRLEKR
jgi:TetR/AcrR family transcriptional regulator